MSDDVDDCGPYYDDLHRGFEFPVPTPVTITGGVAAQHLAITGDALPLTVDQDLCLAVTGSSALLISPALVMHLSIGASTVATRKVLANLFYRDVVLRRQVFEGATLETATHVAAMADGSIRPGRPPRGKALLGITTTSGDDVVVDYQRCPLLPCRGDALPGFDDDIGSAASVERDDLSRFVSAAPLEWDLAPLGQTAAWDIGTVRHDPLVDVVDNATSLARLTHNLAAVHRDARASVHQRRLVYGGHSVSLAQASLGRVLPGIATVLGWQSCDHTAPVFEDDVLECSHELVAEVVTSGGRVRAIRTSVVAHRAGEAPSTVLDWRPVLYTT